MLAGMGSCRHEGEIGMASAKEFKSAGKSGITGKRLYRSGREKILGGVCGGIAEYFNIDPTFVRLVWVLLSLAWGFGVLLYIIMWVITPRNPRDKWAS
jgi:phage shock protein PspC (stress-responsive transcriptional regulator)